MLVALLAALAAHAGEERKATILARAFSYDYSLKERAGKSVGLAVVHKPGSDNADEWVKAFKTLEGVTVQGLPLTVSKVAFEGADKLKAKIASDGLDIIFVCDGLESDLSTIKESVREKHVLSVGATEAMVQQGLTLGVFADGAKTVITVNLSAAGAEGVSFSSELLRLAKVIR